VGLCVVDYYEGMADAANPDNGLLDDGINQCTRAVRADPRLEKAHDTLAKLYLAQGNLNQAISAANAGLEVYPASVNLLLTRAQIELARGNPEDALVYLARARSIDPASEPVLRTRAIAYLALANLATGQERLLRYGRAAIAAEEYLLFYPGDPDGYILLAEARMQEANIDRAIYTLNRVIENEDSLPESEQPAIIAAYTLRSQIYQQRLDWEAAYDDLEKLLEFDPENLLLVELHAQAARELRNYPILLDDIDTLLADNPTRADLILEKAQILSRICQYEATDLECDYAAVLDELLTPDFVTTLTPEQQADATIYRAEAQFAQLAEDTTITEANRRTALQAIRQTVQAAITTRETAEDYYLLARVLEALEQPQPALTAYEWIAYWNQFYEYPFGTEAARAADNLRTAIEDAAES
jgi:tetratricopeptide (TPR) repeat protein